jgi:hypothetical protein
VLSPLLGNSIFKRFPYSDKTVSQDLAAGTRQSLGCLFWCPIRRVECRRVYAARDQGPMEKSDLTPPFNWEQTAILVTARIGCGRRSRRCMFLGNGSPYATRKQGTFTRRHFLIRSEFGRHGLALSQQTRCLHARSGCQAAQDHAEEDDEYRA